MTEEQVLQLLELNTQISTKLDKLDKLEELIKINTTMNHTLIIIVLFVILLLVISIFWRGKKC